jgi:hypothetical protein
MKLKYYQLKKLFFLLGLCFKCFPSIFRDKKKFESTRLARQTHNIDHET